MKLFRYSWVSQFNHEKYDFPSKIHDSIIKITWVLIVNSINLIDKYSIYELASISL